MTTLIEEMKSAATELEKAVAAAREVMKEKVSPALCEFVKTHSDVITSITWTQYTPYFNDGEACEFRVNDVYFKLNSEAFPEEFREEIESSSDYEDGNMSAWELKTLFLGYTQTWGEEKYFAPKHTLSASLHERLSSFLVAFEDISRVIGSSALEDSLQSIFGDHVRVTVTAYGIETEDYDHD